MTFRFCSPHMPPHPSIAPYIAMYNLQCTNIYLYLHALNLHSLTEHDVLFWWKSYECLHLVKGSKCPTQKLLMIGADSEAYSLGQDSVRDSWIKDWSLNQEMEINLKSKMWWDTTREKNFYFSYLLQQFRIIYLWISKTFIVEYFYHICNYWYSWYL